MKNILLTIAYDGTGFAGWQRQPKQRTAQGVLEKALSEVCRTEIKINGTSRTDAGVHAYGQRANFQADFGIPVDKLQYAVNNYLSKEVAVIGGISDMKVIQVEEVPPNFHARFDAKAKTYLYKIRNAQNTDVFDRNFCYQIRRPLNVNAMEKAAERIVGTHDFKCFQAQGGKIIDNTVRTIMNLQIYRDIMEERADFTDQILTIEVTGDGFLYNMVRIIVGTLVDIGTGKISHKKIDEIIKSKERQKAGHTAPPQGLYLTEVFYERKGAL
ncbi:MAG: tRNA pseudouridine(38-40) synthase TruA [Anaerovorax sp.]